MPGTRTIKDGTVWIVGEQGKHFCHCGCNGEIKIQIHHHARGAPQFINGHYSRVNNPMAGRCGDKNPHYNEGQHINSYGYISVLIPGPGRSRYALEHRLRMEQSLGRKLKRGEHVHHRNGIKTDNRLDNLLLISHSDHSKHHAKNGETGWALYWARKRRINEGTHPTSDSC